MRMALGTWVAIEADGPAAAIDGAFAAIAAVEERLHPSREGSDLQRLRDSPSGARVGVHPMTFRVLSFARRLFALSGGVFDPCLPGRPGRLGDLELGYGATGAPWACCSRPLEIDCGGVAKGYAIDRAVEALQGADCTAGLVNAGGDLRVFGRARRTILVRRADGRCEPVELGGGAIAVSDRDSSRAPRGHRGYYRRGAPASPARRFAAVHAADAMTADGLTKCVLLCDPEQARAIVRALGGRLLG
jgi:thiamine biosynthesis lipoprotein